MKSAARGRRRAAACVDSVLRAVPAPARRGCRRRRARARARRATARRQRGAARERRALGAASGARRAGCRGPTSRSARARSRSTSGGARGAAGAQRRERRGQLALGLGRDRKPCVAGAERTHAAAWYHATDHKVRMADDATTRNRSATAPGARQRALYRDPDVAELEQRARSSPAPGSSRRTSRSCRTRALPHRHGRPQPVLVLRDEDGELRAFRNVCRHRGSRLLSGSGECGKAIRCRYHGWTYRTDGELIGVPEGALDRRASTSRRSACSRRASRRSAGSSS